MKIVVPVAKHSDCDLSDTEHMDRIELVVDEFGLTDLVCPEHGRVTEFGKLEFEDEAAFEAWKENR